MIALQRKYLLLMCITGFVVSLDQITKLYVHTQFRLHESVAVIPDFFSITYVRNYGAAFGILGQSSATFREIFFLLVPPIACLTIVYILRTVKDSDLRQIIALSGIFAGALGNYIDRVQFRYVIDFIEFYYGPHSFPAFNVADMTIVGGVISLVYFMLRESDAPAS